MVFIRSLLLFAAMTGFSVACSTSNHGTSSNHNVEASVVVPLQTRAPASVEGDLLGFKSSFNLADYKGRTYLNFMKLTVKPALDEYAKNGFKIESGKALVANLKNVSPRVAERIRNNAGGSLGLMALGEAFSKLDRSFTFYNLPEYLRTTAKVGDLYGMTTHLALLSGQGVAIKFAENNWGYNVNYGSGEIEKDEMSGRSYGVGPTHAADDATDAAYLKSLQDFVKSGDPEIFYQTLLEVLTDNNSENYLKIKPEGQSVLSDFLAVYTAEQDRHLMSNLKTHAWDIALLEVTLLGAFHSGQSTIKVMYEHPQTKKVSYTASTFEQRGLKTNKDTKVCEKAVLGKKQNASMVDWWQFTDNLNAKPCSRSGINITKNQFRKLEGYITAFERANNEKLLQKLDEHFGYKTNNAFKSFTSFLINPSMLSDSKASLGQNGKDLVTDFGAFLGQVRKDAKKIDAYIENQMKDPKAENEAFAKNKDHEDDDSNKDDN